MFSIENSKFIFKILRKSENTYSLLKLVNNVKENVITGKCSHYIVMLKEQILKQCIPFNSNHLTVVRVANIS